MKKLLLLLLWLFMITTAEAQLYKLQENEGIIGGGLGVTWIDGEPHYTFRLFPEFAFANFGVGLDLRLDYDPKGHLRTENFNEFSDYLSIIRYVRYGQKRDPVYARLGALDYATLGHGSIMYLYNNSPSFDTRKIGLEFDIDFTAFGIDTVYGNFGQAGVAGLRGYVRPLQFTDLAEIPIIGKFEIGASYAADFHEYAGVDVGNYNAASDKFSATHDYGTISILGIDFGLPILRTGIADVDLYFDYAKIIDFGSGTALGVMAEFNGLGLVNIHTRMERRFNGKNYLPSYFNSFYELERFKLNKTGNFVTSKVQQLANADVGNGWYGELYFSVIGTFNVLGSYQRLDDYPQSGILHLASEIAPESLPFILRAGYDKVNIKDEKDLFKLDDRSYLFTEFGYKPYPFMIVSLVYNWTFTPIRDADDNIIDYKPQKRIEPRISFIFPVSFGG